MVSPHRWDTPRQGDRQGDEGHSAAIKQWGTIKCEQCNQQIMCSKIHLWLWSTPDLRANSGMPPIAANPKIAGKRPRAKEARLHAEQLFFNRLFVAISTIWSKWQLYPVKDVQNLMDIKVFYNLVWRRVSREFGTEEPLDADCVCRALGLDIVERDDTTLLRRGLLLK